VTGGTGTPRLCCIGNYEEKTRHSLDLFFIRSSARALEAHASFFCIRSVNE